MKKGAILVNIVGSCAIIKLDNINGQFFKEEGNNSKFNVKPRELESTRAVRTFKMSETGVSE